MRQPAAPFTPETNSRRLPNEQRSRPHAGTNQVGLSGSGLEEAVGSEPFARWRWKNPAGQAQPGRGSERAADGGARGRAPRAVLSKRAERKAGRTQAANTRPSLPTRWTAAAQILTPREGPLAMDAGD